MNVSWPDAELKRIVVDYDSLELELRESSGARRTIRAEGYIGYDAIGVWDEMVIEQAELFDSHAAIDRCVGTIAHRLGSTFPDSGSRARNARSWRALLIHFADGCVLTIVAAEFTAA